MKYSCYFWDEDDDPAGNVQHVGEHDLAVEDVEAVLSAPVSKGHSDSSGFPAVWGYVPDGRFIIVVFEEIDMTQHVGDNQLVLDGTVCFE